MPQDTAATCCRIHFLNRFLVCGGALPPGVFFPARFRTGMAEKTGFMQNGISGCLHNNDIVINEELPYV
jgi:hypothetical protein